MLENFIEGAMKIISLFFLLVGIFPPCFAQGAAIYVNSSSGGGANNGSSWEDAYLSLQDALAAATSGDDIWVAQGTYYPDEGMGQTNGDRSATFALKSGVKVYGGFSNTGEPIQLDRNPDLYPVVLSGDIDQNDGEGFQNNENNSFHVLTAADLDVAAVLDGFEIIAGNAGGGSYPESVGGGLFCPNSKDLSVTHCKFNGNFAAEDGGGIYLFGESILLTDCSFRRNSCLIGGGAILIEGSGSTISEDAIILTNCSFQGNSAQDGGAVLDDSSRTTRFVNCSFQGNLGENGGALHFSAASATLINCSLQGNSALKGGAVFNFVSTTELKNCILWANSENGSISAEGASLINENQSSSSFFHCLVQNMDLTSTGVGNFNGNDSTNNPRFVAQLNPSLAPSAMGDLRLLSGSPALNSGSDDENTTVLDLIGNPRKVGTIDLGAFEGTVDLASVWNSDIDSDGASYGYEVAIGTDPASASSVDFYPLTSIQWASGNLTFDFLVNSLAPVGTQWVITRSPDLTFDSFSEIFRFDGTTSNSVNGVSSVRGENGFMITVAGASELKAFYRLEVRYVTP